MGKPRTSCVSATLAIVPSSASRTLASQRERSADERGADERVRPGDVVGDKYRVEALLGEGGMGYVVRAHHLQLDSRVALKFMHGAIVTRDAKRRFLREARSVASLRSRHVARVLDVGTHRDGTPYIVMEHLEGLDLARLLEERGPLPVEEACLYVAQACEALAEAHARGIVHRDLKLGNLFLTRGFEGEPVIKVLDFGVSKGPEHEEIPLDLTMLDSTSDGDTLTRAGDVLGSPHFMAPEQLVSIRNADRQSDVWALGVVLFTLLAGRLPFDADAIGNLVHQIAIAPIPRLRDARRGVPPVVDHVVARCLERDRLRRVRDCLELASLLGLFVRRPARWAERSLSPSSAPPPSLPTPSLPAPLPRESAPVSAFALALLALGITCLAIAIALTAVYRR